MKIDPVLNKAIHLARSRKYESAIRTLEPEVNRYSGSYRYYYLLAVSCLYSGDFGGALTYFRLAREVKMRDPNTMLGLAALYLRRRETGKAVDFYLDVQEIDPKNKTAKKALSVIRKHSDDDSFSAWLEKGKLPGLYPPIPFPGFTAQMVVIPAVCLAAALLLGFGLLITFRVLPNPFAKPVEKPGRVQAVQLSLSGEERGDPLELGGSYRYILTRDQAVDTYDKALSLFNAYRDEAAKINLNRILESNASEGLKNKSRLLLSYLEVPGFDNFKHGDNVSYSEVIKEPVLYRDVYVIWKGMATNVQTVGETTSFDFLVGYDTRTTLEGIVPVVFNIATAVSTERSLEVLGRIAPTGSFESPIRLEGVAVHQSGRLEN